MGRLPDAAARDDAARLCFAGSPLRLPAFDAGFAGPRALKGGSREASLVPARATTASARARPRRALLQAVMAGT